MLSKRKVSMNYQKEEMKKNSTPSLGGAILLFYLKTSTLPSGLSVDFSLLILVNLTSERKQKLRNSLNITWSSSNPFVTYCTRNLLYFFNDFSILINGVEEFVVIIHIRIEDEDQANDFFR